MFCLFSLSGFPRNQTSGLIQPGSISHLTPIPYEFMTPIMFCWILHSNGLKLCEQLCYMNLTPDCGQGLVCLFFCRTEPFLMLFVSWDMQRGCSIRCRLVGSCSQCMCMESWAQSSLMSSSHSSCKPSCWTIQSRNHSNLKLGSIECVLVSSPSSARSGGQISGCSDVLTGFNFLVSISLFTTLSVVKSVCASAGQHID